MSQKSQVDGAQKHFAVGRGLLAAAETLNFSMNEQRSGRQMGGSGGGVGGMEGQDGGSQMSRRPSPLGSTMKLFASLGLSPSDLDALAEIPEEDISVETLPRILMQLKSRKGDAAERRAVSSMSSDAAYRGGRDAWDDMGRMGGPSLGQASARGQNSADFGFGSQQDAAPGHSFGMNFNNGGGRERSYSDLSHRDSYGGLGMGSSSSSSNPVFMQRRMGSPSVGKVQDFLGVTPTMFPHVCSLCDFDVHSTLEWNQHVNGLKHAENCRLLVNMYPDWDPGMSTGRSGTHLDNLNLSAGLLGPAPMSSVQGGGGATSSWGGGGGSGGNDPGPSQLRSRVVVVKYDRKPLSNKTLFAFTEPFGRLQEHLVLKNKAFLEMSSHEEAQDMVNYYQQHPASLYGKRISFYVSQRLLVIEKDERAADRPMDRMMDRPMDRMMDRPMDRPMDRMMDRPMDRMMDRPMDRMMDRPMDRMMDRPMDRMMDRPMDRPMERGSKEPSRVVFFSNLPREDDNKTVLLTIAGRFGVVEKHLFLTDQAFVQLRNPNDAEMLVKYYTMNPLTIKGRLIRLNVCTKYKTLNVNWRQGGAAGDRNQRTRGASTSSGSGARSSSRTSSSSRSRGEQKEEEKSEAEEEVSVVIEEVMEEQATDGDPKEEEQTRVEATKEVVERPEEVQEEEEEQGPGDDLVAEEAPGDVGVAEGERHQGAESEGPTERPGAAEEEEKEGNEEAPTDPGESSEVVEGDLSADMSDQDFLENMEDFVTLDELAEEEEEAEGASSSHDISRKGGLRVINIIGFRRGYNYLNELLGLAKPFGKVVKHLVLDLRPEAYFQFETEEEARAMAKFYSSNVTASVCGRPVRISHSMTYPTIQCGSSKVVYIGLLPSTKYSDEDVLKLAEPFGPVRKYFTNRIKRECFIEMEEAEDAEKMADHCKANPPKLHGKRLTSIYVSRKYRQLKHGHRCPSTAKRESRSSSPKPSEEPPAKKVKREEQEEEKEEQEEEEQQQEEEKEEEEQQQQKEEQVQSSDQENSAEKTPQVCEELHSAVEEEQQLKEEHKEEQQKELKEQQKEEQQKELKEQQKEEQQKELKEQLKEQQKEEQQQEHKEEQEEVLISRTEQAASPPAPAAEPRPPVAASLPLPPYDASSPIGVEHVKTGFYCRICFLFYSNEDTAKKTHCSSQSHYDKLQKHLEKEQTKAEKKKGRKTAA